MPQNSFGGKLLEFPDIAVDKFNVDAKIFLLSHCHSDHLVGLANKSFQSTVYCSELTKQIFSLDNRNAPWLRYLRGIAFNSPFSIILNDKKVVLTLISAYHCPGSAMFLVESEEKNVLFTGDIRAETWWTMGLKKNMYLFPYTCGFKSLDCIYLDTTFGYRREPYIEIPPNTDGIAAAIKMLSLYPTDDPDIEFFFADHTLGFEQAWSMIVSSLGGSMHMSNRILQRSVVVSKNPNCETYESVLGHFDTNGGQKFHACEEGFCSQKVKFPVRIKQCINLNVIDFVGCLLPVDMKTLTDKGKQGIQVVDYTTKGNAIVRYRGRTWIQVNNELLPSEIKLVFSRHSSYSECKEFVKTFNPVSVYPCVTSKGTWENGFVMSRLFKDVCVSGGIENFAFDVINCATHGIPISPIMVRPVKTINRWDLQDCENELRFVAKY
ncbi:hypothetical protein CANTEDRAFT_110826, partial [Yamadazyma tenuis ATCC 10573]